MPPPADDDDSWSDDSLRSASRKGEADAFAALSLVLSGVLFWGGVGFGLSRWLDNQLFVMLGLLLGMGGGLYLVWFRYGKQQ